MGELPMFTVDSFADKPFAGNPAAVCLDVTKYGLSEDVMQKIGAEMNISETAFIQKLSPGDSFENSNRFKLRWFTPTSEVSLCGHGTLAASAVLFKCKGNMNECLFFETLSGELQARKRGENIALDLPINKPQPTARDGFEDLLKLAIGDLMAQDLAYSTSTKKLLIRLVDSTTRKDLESLTPQIDKFTSTSTTKPVLGVIVTLRGSQENGAVNGSGKMYDFISRYFAPWVGIPEDPVTGAAHTVLCAYWADQLQKSTLYARQCSKRGGDVNLVVGDRLDISGPATVVLKGSMFL